jgi:hypothetical protein
MIPTNIRERFALLIEAARAGRLALVETTRRGDGGPAFIVVLTAPKPGAQDGEQEMYPAAVMLTEGEFVKQLHPPKGTHTEAAKPDRPGDAQPVAAPMTALEQKDQVCMGCGFAPSKPGELYFIEDKLHWHDWVLCAPCCQTEKAAKILPPDTQPT